ncbi:MAG TPA: PAS domain-containing protein [Ureibacillus sp.]|nr:PAS domain-containing protein [Ureibacillus sp.]
MQKGHFLEVNPATERITGYNNGELIGNNYSQIITRKEFQAAQKFFQQAVARETVRYESVI